jgi:hypothetical protein
VTAREQAEAGHNGRGPWQVQGAWGGVWSIACGARLKRPVGAIRESPLRGVEHSVWSEIETALGGRVVRSEPMSRHTTLRIGGPADLFIEATSADDLRDIVLLARRDQVRYFILGAGSNLLVSDAGIRGLVILNKARQIKFQDSSLKSQTGAEP